MHLRSKFLCKFFIFAGVCVGVPGFAVAASITGIVTNKTTNKPAAGDTVTLIRLAQGMQEAGSTTTDARGKFILDLPDDGVHLVKVTHDKASYFQPVEPGAQSVDVDVFNAAAKVEGVVAEAEVIHVESDPSGKSLSVIANFFIKNSSTPPKTQFSDRPFEFYLPPGAVVEGSDAVGPGRMAMRVKSPPVPLEDPGHYAMIFPLRPCPSPQQAAQNKDCGETRFQVSYRLPYTGNLTLTPKVAVPTDALVVMLPKSMSFRPDTSTPYQPVNEALSAQAYVAQNVQPSQPLGFTVSGIGQLPRDTQAAATGQQAAAPDAPNASSDLSPSEASARQRADTKPGVGLNNPLDSEGDLEPWAKYKWWILGVLGLALAGGAGVMLKSNPAGRAVRHAGPDFAVIPSGAIPASTPSALLQALKDELFTLETDRLEGKLSDTAYAEQKSALEVVLRRALARGRDVSIEPEPDASNG